MQSKVAKAGRVAALVVIAFSVFSWFLMLIGLATSYSEAKSHEGWGENERASAFGASWFLLWAHLFLLLLVSVVLVLGRYKDVLSRFMTPIFIIVLGIFAPHADRVLSVMRAWDDDSHFDNRMRTWAAGVILVLTSELLLFFIYLGAGQLLGTTPSPQDTAGPAATSATPETTVATGAGRKAPHAAHHDAVSEQEAPPITVTAAPKQPKPSTEMAASPEAAERGAGPAPAPAAAGGRPAAPTAQTPQQPAVAPPQYATAGPPAVQPGSATGGAAYPLT